MATDDSILWIKTRDGSPTLWSNELSEPFRSTKGAFSESWTAFVMPALTAALHLKERNSLKSICLGEFGLGPGTNWVIWSLAAKLLKIDFTYFVIEKEISYFEAGLKRWSLDSAEIASFVEKSVEEAFGVIGAAAKIEELGNPKIYESIESANSTKPVSLADIWFHDPFGFAVNPEGYSQDTISKCEKLWAPHVAGFTYAANRQFREALAGLKAGIVFKNCDTGNQALKRNRSEFYGPLYPIISELS